MSVFGPILSGVAVGGDGEATANTDTTHPVKGLIAQIDITYHDSPPAETTDVIIATKGKNAPALTILTVSNSATNGSYPVRVEEVDNTGSGQSAYTPLVVDDYINVKIDDANAGDYVKVYLHMVD